MTDRNMTCETHLVPCAYKLIYLYINSRPIYYTKKEIIIDINITIEIYFVENSRILPKRINKNIR